MYKEDLPKVEYKVELKKEEVTKDILNDGRKFVNILEEELKYLINELGYKTEGVTTVEGAKEIKEQMKKDGYEIELTTKEKGYGTLDNLEIFKDGKPTNKGVIINTQMLSSNDKSKVIQKVVRY